MIYRISFRFLFLYSNVSDCIPALAFSHSHETYFRIPILFVRNMSEFTFRIHSTINYIHTAYLQFRFYLHRKEPTMNPLTTSSHLTLHAHRAFTHPLSALRLILLFVMLALLSSLSVPAAEPPNSVHPPSHTVPASLTLRTSRARNTPRPQADIGWSYADDSRHWYYQLPVQSTSLLNTAPPSASSPDTQDSSYQLLKTGWHHDIDGFTYYLDPSDGHMLAGTHTINGIEYSFLPERDRGNYHQDSLGAWFYRANGLAPYGSLLFSRSRSDRHATPAAITPTHPILRSTASRVTTGRRFSRTATPTVTASRITAPCFCT